MFLHPALNTPTIKINHATNNEIRSTIDDIHSIESTTIIKLFNRNIAEYQRQQQYHPSSFLIIQQESKEREKHIECKYRSKEPSHTYHLNIWIRQEIEAHCQICKTLTERTPGWLHHKANHHHHGEEWPGTMIALSIELRRSYCSRLYSFIISTAHTERTNNHEQQCEIREPRNHTTSQEVITWLNHKISLNVHQHNTYCCVSTQAIQRRVIFSDIYRYGGVLLFILAFIYFTILIDQLCSLLLYFNIFL